MSLEMIKHCYHYMQLKKSKSNLQYIKNQQKKETNKMEKINTKLKERLNSVRNLYRLLSVIYYISA